MRHDDATMSTCLAVSSTETAKENSVHKTKPRHRTARLARAHRAGCRWNLSAKYTCTGNSTTLNLKVAACYMQEQ